MNTQIPAPDPDDISQGIAAVEAHLAAQAGDIAEAPAVPVRLPDGEFDGETRRVRKLKAEVAEAHQLAELLDDDTALRLDTDKVRKRRAKAHEAARLHALAQDPVMRAYSAARFRRVLVGAAMVSLTLALAWSSAGVQKFAADGAPAGSAAWWCAWLVEPFLSIALLVVVGARAYMGTKGQPIKNATLTKLEVLFMGLTLLMNAWPYLPKVAEEFSFSRLVLHLLGPVVAVAIVTALPIILEAFSRLDHGAPHTAPHVARTAPQIGIDQQERPATGGGDNGKTWPLAVAHEARRKAGERTRRRIADYRHEFPQASTTQIATALGVSTETVRRHLREMQGGDR